MVKYKDVEELHNSINKLYNKRIRLINDRELKKAEDITNEIVGLRDRLNVMEREWVQDVEDNARLSKAIIELMS